MRRFVLLLVVFAAANIASANYEFMNVDLKMRYDIPSRLADTFGLGSWLRDIRSRGTLSFRGYDVAETSYRWNWRRNRWDEDRLKFGVYFESQRKDGNDPDTTISIESRSGSGVSFGGSWRF